MKIKLEKRHYQWGLTAFLVIMCSVLVFFCIYRFSVIGEIFSVLINVVSPFILGLVMAYLLCPIYNFSVREAYKLFNSGKYRFKHDLTASKFIGSIISLLIMVVVIVGVIWMILPGLFDSVFTVVQMLPDAIQQFIAWGDAKLAKLPVDQAYLENWSKDLTAYLTDYVTNTVLPEFGSLAAAATAAMIGAIGKLFDLILGVVVCLYFLNIKDTLAAQSKKLIIAYCKESTAEEILQGAEFANRTFGGFISGKLIDSAIIGIICFIVMSIFGWEYSLLISCIIGITNIIPFFGPFIGAVPSALLLLMVNPMHCLYFIIFVLILQQFDGNILGPKILGGSTGLSSFWVLFAVLVGGGLFGFIGMVVSIPVFAIIYTYCARNLNRRLKKKGFSIDTLDYKVDKYRVMPRRKRKKNKKDKEEKEEENEN